jgi:hypothetical protein
MSSVVALFKCLHVTLKVWVMPRTQMERET